MAKTETDEQRDTRVAAENAAAAAERIRALDVQEQDNHNRVHGVTPGTPPAPATVEPKGE